MIRWARRVDDELGIVAGTLAAWRAAWLRRWSPAAASPRKCLNLTAAAPVEVEARLADLARRDALWPGTRLVVTLGPLAAHEPSGSGGLLAVFDRAGWAPELPHCCDPLPGDPRATAAWRERERIFMDRFGRTRLGMVMAKKLQPADMEKTVFAPLLAPHAAADDARERDYFPLPVDGRLPLPERVLEGGPFKAGDLASAFGIAPQDAMPLIDELLASGAISVVERIS